MMDKGKGQTSRADEEGFMEMKRKKSGGNNGGNKNFKQVLLKPKTLYHPKAKQLAKGMSNSPKTTPFVGTNKALKSCNNKDCTKSPSNKGNGFLDDVNLVSLSNSFEALNDRNPVLKEVVKGNAATYFGSKDEVKPVDNEPTIVHDEYEPYDDDMYESQDIPDNIQTICDNLDIK
ncbi:hypothetical protein Tco_0675455, partial [Tanacetum coccineum]